MSISSKPRQSQLLDPHFHSPLALAPSKDNAPGLAIYLDREGTISVSSTSLTITVGGSNYLFPYLGRTLQELASDISGSSGFILCNALNRSAPLTANFLYLDSLEDVTADGGQIIRVRGHTTRYLEETQIRVLVPYQETRLLPWYPLIDRGSVSIVKDGVTYVFSIPEYYQQEWSVLFGAPFVDQVGIKAEYVDSLTVRVARTPIFWHKNNLALNINDRPTGAALVSDVDVHNGLIRLRTPISRTDKVFVDYTYREDRLIYKGVNLNPSMEHNPAVIDQTVLVYLVPAKSSLGTARLSTVNSITAKTLTGALASIPKSTEPVLIIGAFQVRPSGVIGDLVVTDTRSRGGGIREEKYRDALKNNREAYSTADAGRWDGVPFPGAAVGILRLPRAVLDTHDLDFVDNTVRRHLAIGGNLLLDFVD